MRLLIYTITFFLSSNVVQSQQIIQKTIQEFSISNSSGELLNIIKDELKKENIKLPETNSINKIIVDEKTRQAYVSYYESQLKKAYTASGVSADVLLNINPEKLINYGNTALNRFKSVSPGKYLDQIIEPVLGTSIIMYARDTIKGFFRNKVDDINQLTNYALSALLQKGYDFKNKTEEDIKAQILALKANLKFDPLNDLLLEEIEQQAIYLIEKSPASITISNARRASNQFINDFNNVRNEVSIAAKSAFDDLGNSMKVLSDNEKIVNVTIQNIQHEINNRKNTIDKLEKDLYNDAKNKITDFQKQALHAELVAKNLFQIDIVNSYVKSGINIISHVDDYKATAKKLFSGDYLNDFKRQLDVLKTPTLSGVITFTSSAVGTVEQVEGTLEKLGIIKGAAAKKVTKIYCRC